MRHVCEGEQQPNPFQVLGQIDRLGEGVFWGIDIPGGPQPYQFAWRFCPHCAEQFPLKVSDWDKSTGRLKVDRPMGFELTHA